jgi:hypothetical protein
LYFELGKNNKFVVVYSYIGMGNLDFCRNVYMYVHI